MEFVQLPAIRATRCSLYGFLPSKEQALVGLYVYRLRGPLLALTGHRFPATELHMANFSVPLGICAICLFFPPHPCSPTNVKACGAIRANLRRIPGGGGLYPLIKRP